MMKEFDEEFGKFVGEKPDESADLEIGMLEKHRQAAQRRFMGRKLQ